MTIIYIPNTLRTTPEVGDIFTCKDEAPFFKAGKHCLEPWDDMNVYHAEDITIFNEDDFDSFANEDIVILEAVDCPLDEYNQAKRTYLETLVDDVHETEVGSLTSNFKIDGWKLQAIVDGDNHLTLAVTHIDHSKVHSMDVDIASDDYEYVERYTTTQIESEQELDDDGNPEAIGDTYTAWTKYTSSLMAMHNKKIELSDFGENDFHDDVEYGRLNVLNKANKTALNDCIARLHIDGFSPHVVEKYEPSNTHADRLLENMVVQALALNEDHREKAYRLITGNNDYASIGYHETVSEIQKGLTTTSPEKLLSYLIEVEL
jgi:hypothetical protein